MNTWTITVSLFEGEGVCVSMATTIRYIEFATSYPVAQALEKPIQNIEDDGVYYRGRVWM